MDQSASPNGTARRINTASLSAEPDVDLLWREEINSALEMAENVLNRSRPSPETEESTRRFLEAGSPVRASERSQISVSPANVEKSDGFVGLEAEALQSQLDDRADQLVKVDVETTVQFSQDTQPVRIQYEFERPVTAIEDGHGQFYTIATENKRVPFQPGIPTTSLVQIISPEQYPSDPKPKTKTLHVRVEGTQAIWTDPSS